MRYEHDEDNENSKRFSEQLCLILFGILMAVGLILGFIFALRPTESKAENRHLTEFPKFNIWSFFEGDYTETIGKWYSDTYPGRDLFVRAEQGIQNLYGIRTSVVAHQGQSDDIPDITWEVTDPTEEEPGTEAPTDTYVMPTDPYVAPTETEAPTEYVYETVDGDELSRMNPQEAGNVNVKDGAGYAVYGFNLSAAERYAEAVEKLMSNLTGRNIRLYELLIPNNSAILLDDATKAAWKLTDERKVINYYYGATKAKVPSVQPVNVYDALLAHKTEYLYFRTDHHWTALGAYYAYREFCKTAGFTPHELAEYYSETAPTFVGSYVNTNGLTQLRDHADSVTYYWPLANNDIRFWDEEQNAFRNGSIIRNMSPWPHKTMGHIYEYMGFIYGDHAISYMKNDEIKNGRSILVIKESFGNCFVPFLLDHYEKVVVVDYRYFQSNSISKVAIDENVTDVLFINNLEAISNLSSMNVLYDRCN